MIVPSLPPLSKQELYYYLSEGGDVTEWWRAKKRLGYDLERDFIPLIQSFYEKGVIIDVYNPLIKEHEIRIRTAVPKLTDQELTNLWPIFEHLKPHIKTIVRKIVKSHIFWDEVERGETIGQILDRYTRSTDFIDLAGLKKYTISSPVAYILTGKYTYVLTQGDITMLGYVFKYPWRALDRNYWLETVMPQIYEQTGGVIPDEIYTPDELADQVAMDVYDFGYRPAKFDAFLMGEPLGNDDGLYSLKYLYWQCKNISPGEIIAAYRIGNVAYQLSTRRSVMVLTKGVPVEIRRYVNWTSDETGWDWVKRPKGTLPLFVAPLSEPSPRYITMPSKQPPLVMTKRTRLTDF